MSDRVFIVLGAGLWVAGCSPKQAPTVEPAAQTATEPAADPAVDPECHPAKPARRVEVGAGETSKPVDDIIVTYVTYQHDNFDDGTTDAFVELRFNGVVDGEPTPSELRWMPSLFDKPRFVHLEIDRCVRLVEGDETRVVLELFRP